MKNIYFTLLLTFLTVTGLNAQSILACYPLVSDGVDTTGINGDVFLKNAPFQNGGVFSNGIYDDTDGSVIATPGIVNFNYDDFSLLLDFYIEEYQDCGKPVIVGGPSYRWIGAYITETGQFELMANDYSVYVTSNEVISLNTWNLLAISYNKASEQLSLYVNHELISQLNVPVINHSNDGDIVNYNGGFGETFKGYWRNLKIYNSSLVAGISENNKLKGIKVSQDHSELHILIPQDKTNVEMQVVSMNGECLNSLTLTPGLNQVNTAFLKPGIYLLIFTTKSGQRAVMEIAIAK